VSDSILRRFGSTLMTNAISSGVSFTATLIIARGLGPQIYGDYAFLIASFAALNTWLELGTPTAFYTFLSKSRDARAHVELYLAWLALRLILVAAAIVLLPHSWLDRIWLGHPRGLVLGAFGAFFASVVVRGYLVQIAESTRKTVFIQSGLAVLSLAHLALVVFLRLSGALSVQALFTLLLSEYAALSLWFFWRFDLALLGPNAVNPDWRAIVARYSKYCAPLALYAVLGFAADFADRWLLQRFGGSAQQGYFSIGWQFATIALLATTSLLNIFWKEIAAAEALADRARARDLYNRSSRLLFFVAAAGGCFLAPHSRALLDLTAGTQFSDAAPVLAIMLLFPAFQSLSQLNGAFFYATEDTRTHVSISSIGLAVGLPLTYLALAPRDAAIPGLALGALGLAARLWLVQAAIVSLQCAVVRRRLGSDIGPGFHWVTLIFLGALGVAAGALGSAASRGLSLPRADVWAVLFSAVPFAAGLASLAWFFPSRVGADRAHIDRILRWRLS
jgi:O-antigen/teichoic acid export membrane protein